MKKIKKFFNKLKCKIVYFFNEITTYPEDDFTNIYKETYKDFSYKSDLESFKKDGEKIKSDWEKIIRW